MFVKGSSRDRAYMRLANLERVRGFDTEWKLLRRPAKHSLSNLAPCWANGNLGTDSSHAATNSQHIYEVRPRKDKRGFDIVDS